MKSVICALCAVGLPVFAAVAGAETLYVTDTLLLGLHEASDTSDRAFRSLESGVALEVLERNNNYARVRTPAGEEGWTKVRFLVSEAPARFRLLELEAENESLGERARVLEERLASEVSRIEALEARIETAGDERARLVSIQAENARFRDMIDRVGNRVPFHMAVITGLAALVLGFAGGFGWIDRRLRQRYGRLRLY